VWLGVSVEDQRTADERIPVMLTLPAAVRWVSYEPALGPVDFAGEVGGDDWLGDRHDDAPGEAGIDWIVVGGESGPGARPFDLAWARSTVAACKAAGTKCFVKQLGAHPVAVPVEGPFQKTTAGGDPWPAQPLNLRDPKGGDPSEWPEDLRVREWPEVRHG
jgi:protein gp37